MTQLILILHVIGNYVIVMNNSFKFNKVSLYKIHELMSSYSCKKFERININYHEYPSYNNTEYKYLELPNELKILFNSIKNFFEQELEYPIFITIFFNNYEKLSGGNYVLNFEKNSIQKVREYSLFNNDIPLSEFSFGISYFIDSEFIDYQNDYSGYIKSCIEIGRIDEFISNSLIYMNTVRYFLPTNKFTKNQGINLSKKFLTQTTIFNKNY